MQVFISWSGSRSRAVADALGAWLSQVIQAVDPWISSEIDKGARWSAEVSAKLETCKIGIVCLTRENLNNPWILFESGALSKTKDAYVCTLLLDIAPAEVEQPLAQFQSTSRDKSDIHRLVRTVNKAVEKSAERALPESRLDEVFEIYWPKLSDVLESIAGKEQDHPSHAVRSERELLEELLELARANERQFSDLARGAMRTLLTNLLSSSHGNSTDRLFGLFEPSYRKERGKIDVSALIALLQAAKVTPESIEETSDPKHQKTDDHA